MLMKRDTSQPANASSAFFTGDPFEIATRPTLCNAGMTAQVTGLLLGITVGSNLIQVESAVDILAGVFPRIPDEMSVTYVAMQNERQVYQVRNTTGAAIIARGIVLMQYV